MVTKQLKDIQIADLEALQANAVRESRTLDYKEALPGNTDDEKKDFLADIVSFANAGGGDMVLGFKEVREAGRSTGLAELVGLQGSVNQDAEKLRIDSMIRDGIKPRVTGVQIHFVEGHSKGLLGVIRIPQSWAAPHMVTFRMRDAFFSRNNAGKYPLAVEEIRNAFMLSDSAAQRVRDFRMERIGRIVAGETPLPLPAGSTKVVLHIVPLQAPAGQGTVDFSPLKSDPGLGSPIYSRGWNHRYNFDGYLTYSGRDTGEASSYLQVFRDGRLEAVCCSLIRADQEKRIPFIALERELIGSLKTYLSLGKAIGVTPPAVVMLSMIGVKGAHITTNSFFPGERDSIDRPDLLLPDLLVEDFETPTDAILRPAFDAIWNACGYDSCKSYGADGRWRELRTT